MDFEATHQRSRRSSPPLTAGSPNSLWRTSVTVTGSSSMPIGGVAEVFCEPVPSGGRVPRPTRESVPVEPVEPTVAAPAAALDGSTLPPRLLTEPMLPSEPGPAEPGAAEPGPDCATAGAAAPQARASASAEARRPRRAWGVGEKAAEKALFTGSPTLR